MGVIALWFLVDPIILIIKADMLPPKWTLISYSPLEYPILKVKLSVIGGVLLLLPYIIYSFTKFKKSRDSVWIWIVAVLALFIAGVSFAYFLTLPLVIRLLIRMTEAGGVISMFSIDKFITFIIIMAVIVGLIFNLPVLMIWLTNMGMVSVQTYKDKRKYAYVGAFVAGALLTDPEPITQVLIALPIVAFYEIGVLGTKVHSSRKKKVETDTTQD